MITLFLVCVFVQLAMVTVLLHTEDSQHLIFKKLFFLMGLWSIWADVLQGCNSRGGSAPFVSHHPPGPSGPARACFVHSKGRGTRGQVETPKAS